MGEGVPRRPGGGTTLSAVYLSGPLADCDDREAFAWRWLVKQELGEDRCLDPSRRDYRNRKLTEGDVDRIVIDDLADISAADVVLAYCWKPSPGTSMEICYTSVIYRKPVIVVVPREKSVSPWVRYHSDELYRTLGEGIEAARRVLERIDRRELERGG